MNQNIFFDNSLSLALLNLFYFSGMTFKHFLILLFGFDLMILHQFFLLFG